MQKTKKREKLSIYLARDAKKPDAEIIKTEKAKEPIAIAIPESDSANLYIKKEPPLHSPTWTKLFTASNQVPEDAFGKSSNVGAVLIIRAYNQTFILSFGTGFHLLNNESIERDFGLRVTLNSVDPEKLRSLDKASYDHNPLNSRTQSTTEVDIFNLHIDSELEMLYAITGVSTVEIFGSHITGRDALTIDVETDLPGIIKILKEAISRYRSKLPEKFDWVENINRVRDLDEIQILDLELDSKFLAGDFSNIWLGEPEIIDWEKQIGYSFELYPRSPRHVVLSIDDYIDHLKSVGLSLSVENTKIGLVHINDSDYKSLKSWSVYRCLYVEISPDTQNNYILRNGVWYKANQDFVKSVDHYLTSLDISKYTFPVYAHDLEEDYNAHVAATDANIILMDKKNLKIGGSYDKIEFCDLVKSGNEFIHVKYYRSSGTLSHLFAQGLNSAETFVSDQAFREKLNPKLPANIQLANPAPRPASSNYRVIYAIATKKNLPNELPFLSKISLKNAVKTLRALDYNVEIAKIDVDPAILLKKKYKPKPKAT